MGGGEVAAAAAVFVGFDSAVKTRAGTQRIYHQAIASEEPGQVITQTGGFEATLRAGTCFSGPWKENKLDAYHECIGAAHARTHDHNNNNNTQLIHFNKFVMRLKPPKKIQEKTVRELPPVMGGNQQTK